MYLKYLVTLAVACILMRVAWIFDIVIQVQQAVDRAKNDPNTAGILVCTVSAVVYVCI